MKTIKFYPKRLLALADFLEKLPPRRFDYRVWVGTDWAGKTDLSCGTTACAMGWAPQVPALKRAGLHMKLAPRLPYDTQNHAMFCVRNQKTGRQLDTGGSATAAAQIVFGINWKEADWLFIPAADPVRSPTFGWTNPGEDATAKQVAKHIRRFVAWKKNAQSKRKQARAR